jgi:pyruvyltransferase
MMIHSNFETVVRGVSLVRWNPSRTDDAGQWSRVDNFGDLLGPLIVSRLVHDAPKPRHTSGRLLAVGSIMHFARPGDVVWGAGINGKIPLEELRTTGLDVRAVRGPLTREALRERGVEVPEVYGDPAMLLPDLLPELREVKRGNAVVVVPNLNDISQEQYQGDMQVVSPTAELFEVLRSVAAARFVVGSSLHSVIVAEAFGVPARFVSSGTEHPFKYHDYLVATGRHADEISESVAGALDRGPMPPPQLDTTALREAFPTDLWQET